jgi:hypothetical protein
MIGNERIEGKKRRSEGGREKERLSGVFECTKGRFMLTEKG